MAGAWLRSLKELSRRAPTEEDIDRLYEEMVGEKLDRAAALVTATVLEESLRNLIKSRMVPLSNNEREQLFERDAPLSTFSKLIRIAYAFGLIDAKVRQHLDCIREIRNAFAHSPNYVTFETNEIKTACMLLDRYYESFSGVFDANHPRAYFIGAAHRLMILFNAARENPSTSLPLHFD